MPNFDENTGFTMNIGSNSKVNDGSFNEKQTGLLKTAPLYKSLVGDKDKGIVMAGDSDEDKVSTEKLDNITMYGRDKSKTRFYPSEVGGTDAKDSPSGGATFTPQVGRPIEKMTNAQLLAERESKKLKK